MNTNANVSPANVIIAGVGGQGINSLAKVIAYLCYAREVQCEYTVHKGGAQTLGSVYAELRIGQRYTAPGIAVGELDILISLDPWEALRHMHLARVGDAQKNTQVWVEREPVPLYVERSNRQAITDPIHSLKQLQLKVPQLKVQLCSYREMARQQFDTVKMANYLAGLDCINALKLCLQEDYSDMFYRHVSRAVEPCRDLRA